MSYQNDGSVNFELLEHIAVLKEQSTGWTKELNLVSWNDGPAKYDIRDWDPAHERMSRGVTLQEQEMRTLVDSFKRRRQNMARIPKTKIEPVNIDTEPILTTEVELAEDSSEEMTL